MIIKESKVGSIRERQKLFWVWADMRQRCKNPNHKAFKNYGGRGISVCKEWRSFKTFLTDMGDRPNGASIDRIDNGGNYTKSNCRWASRKEQNSNRRNCIFVKINTATMTLKDACRFVGIKYRPVHKRIVNYGWPVEKALSVPIRLRAIEQKADA